MKIITSGQKYTEIDVLASAVAYKELLSLFGVDSEIVLPGTFNLSIPDRFKRDLQIKTTPTYSRSNTKYILVDVSDPQYFAEFVREEQIIKLFDHHFGFEKYWNEKLGNNSIIEHIGACATLIWEEYKKKEYEDRISKTSAELLALAIISNTLNLFASVTTERDKDSLHELKSYAGLSNDWKENYFREVSENMLKDPKESMKNDTKILEIGNEKYVIIQIELWDAKKFLLSNEEEITKQLNSYKCDFAFYTSPSISEGFNYIFTVDEKTKIF